MGNKGEIKPAVRFAVVTLDDKEYRLAFSLRGIAHAEKELGINVLSSIGNQQLSGAHLLGQFYGCLKLAQPGITLEEADALCTLNNTPSIVDALGEAYSLSAVSPNPPQAESAAAGD